MKNKKLIIVGVVLVVIFAIFNFGIQIGNVRIGKQIDLQTKQNANFELSDFYKEYYSKDRLTVLNLWATWCEPCIAEIPELNNVMLKHNNKDINFVSISVDKDSVRLVRFLEKEKFKFKDITLENLKYRNAILNILEGYEPDKWISSYSVPVTYLIRNKKVLKKIDGTIEEKELYELIESLK